MITEQPIFLHREFTDIVAKVSERLTAQLQLVDPNITGVHYQFGHPLEIVNTITKYTQAKEAKFKKYPLVAFFLDSQVDRSNPEYYGEQRINMAIIRACKLPSQTANERDLFNFIPVLTPIYMALIEEIKNRGDLFQLERRHVPHTATNRYYWGKEGLFGNEGNIFNDWVDAIEINNMRLRININYCPKTV